MPRWRPSQRQLDRSRPRSWKLLSPENVAEMIGLDGVSVGVTQLFPFVHEKE